MDLIKISDLTTKLGISSRSLRYYEQVGLIRSHRSVHEKYRFFDNDNVERLKQIMILRKMQIPIKDILRIYESEEMSVVVETFVSRIRAIDEEVNALNELRRAVNDFLRAMTQNGITKISALPILWDTMEKQLETLEKRKTMSYGEFSSLSDRLQKPVEASIVVLPPMRVLSTMSKDDGMSDPNGFWRWVQTHGVPLGEPGAHMRFEFQTGAGDVTVIKLIESFENDGPYKDYIFPGGLFAAANLYLDEDMGQRFRSLVASFDGNPYFEIDYTHEGQLRHVPMIEELLSPDTQRVLVSLLVPVKKRLPDPTLFVQPQEIPPDAITVEEIENANPILWSQDVRMDKLIPINRPHYRVTGEGEAEYISWISTRVLSTGVAVTLPFRVDIEFRIGEESGGWGHGKKEESIRFHHGEDLNFLFGINMDNNMDEKLSQKAICFHQPVFGDYYEFPQRGGIIEGAYNKLTWIVGDHHFAVIINGEFRYCGMDFPYMAGGVGRGQPRPIVIGSDSSIKKYFRAIRVSQLIHIPKPKIKEGALTMITKQSNNMIPSIRRFITSEYGENYWFNGCARYVMECAGEFKGEPDFGYWFFAGLTGDVLAQVYPFDHFRGDGVTDYMLSEGGSADFIREVFDRAGYASTFVSDDQLKENPQMYVQTLMTYIDRGMPVIFRASSEWKRGAWGIFVGYEDNGKVLLFLSDNMVEPESVTIEKVLSEKTPDSIIGWVFLGEKKRQISLADAYREAILRMPTLLTTKNERYCFGAEAFRAWASDIEGGKFDGITSEEFNPWLMHNTYICNMATNGSCAHTFLKRAFELNPDMGFIAQILALYERTAQIWNKDNGSDLEALGGGFNVTLANLQDKQRREEIAAKIREAAKCMDDALAIFEKNIPN